MYIYLSIFVGKSKITVMIDARLEKFVPIILYDFVHLISFSFI